MQSSNPVFARSQGFNGRGATQGGSSYASSPSSWSVGSPDSRLSTGAPGTSYEQGRGLPTHTSDERRMTIDSVVQRTAMTLAVVMITASATWVLTADPASTNFRADTALATLGTLSLVGALVGFALAMVNSFKRVVSPALVLAYAAFEGVFVGAFSKVVQTYITPGENTVVMAVLGTVAAFAGTLTAYKVLNIQVTDRFRKFVVAALFGFVGLALLDMVLGFFDADFGFNGFGGMGLLFSVVGLGLGVLMLILDFDFVERGIAAGLPERESWRAAFGLTVTLIWIYLELLRILAILRGSD